MVLYESALYATVAVQLALEALNEVVSPSMETLAKVNLAKRRCKEVLRSKQRNTLYMVLTPSLWTWKRLAHPPNANELYFPASLGLSQRDLKRAERARVIRKLVVYTEKDVRSKDVWTAAEYYCACGWHK